MIISGYSSINEKLQGELADALKDMESFCKDTFLRFFKDKDIDFNRAINKATPIESSKDPRLKDPNNIVIGVYADAETKKKCSMILTHDSFGDRRIICNKINADTIINRSGKAIKVTNKWFDSFLTSELLELMSSVYIIKKNSAPKLSVVLDKKCAKKRAEFKKNFKEVIDTLLSVGRFYSDRDLLKYLSIHKEVPIHYSGYSTIYKYAVVIANSENIKMTKELKEQLIDEGLYNNSYVSIMCPLSKVAPYPESALPTERNESTGKYYIGKLFSKSLDYRLKCDIEGFGLRKAANHVIDFVQGDNLEWR